MEFLLAFILAMTVTVALIPPLMRRAGALHVLDAPEERKVHAGLMPRVGGIAMALGAVGPLLLWLDLDPLPVAYGMGACTVLAFGIWDDRANLGAGIKFFGQLIAVLTVVLVGDVTIHSLTLTERVELPWAVSLPLTVLFLLGVTNAINLADGLDGLAGGTTFLCFAAIALLSLGTGLTFVTVVALTVMGSLLGFLRYNSYPARVFMGDGGSQFLGFTVGVLAVVLTQDPRTPLSAALPLLLLGLPILDTLIVMALRVRAGRSPFSADKRHLHHRLLDLGFDHFESVGLVYVLQCALFLAAWFMRYQSDLLIVAAFVAFAATVAALLVAARLTGWRWQGVGEVRTGERLGARLQWLKEPQRMPRWTARVAAGCVLAYLALAAFAGPEVGRDIGWLAVALAVVLAVASLQRQDHVRFDAITQGALYVTMVAAVYLDHLDNREIEALLLAKAVLFPLLMAAVVLRLRLTRERRFEITPLDLLVVFVALALPNLPGLQGAPSNLGLTVAKLVVLFYAVELLSTHSRRTRKLLWAGGVVFLCVIAGRGLA